MHKKKIGGIFMEEVKNNVKVEEKNTVRATKKRNKILKIIGLVLLVIILIYVAILIWKASIMNSLSNKAEKSKKTMNYYTKQYTYMGDTFITTESYHLGNDYLTTHTWFSDSKEIRKIVSYQKGDERISLLETDGKKYILDANTIVGGNILPLTYLSNGFMANLQYAFSVDVESADCKGKECYVIKGDNYQRYLDKETGLVVRTIESDQVTDFEFIFNEVKDTDIVKPDTTGAMMHE